MENAPAVCGGRGSDLLVEADVDETQTAPGLDVLVTISADEKGRAVVKAPEAVMAVTTVVLVVHAMTAMTAVATMTPVLAGGCRGHRSCRQSDGGDDSE